MSNFSIYFSRPLFLLLLAPALFLTLFPYFRLPKVRRRTFRHVLPLALRTIILLIVVMLISGISFYGNYKESSIIIVADQSFSTEKQQDDMNLFISSIVENADRKTKIGIVTFANDSVYSSNIDSNPNDIYNNYLNCETTPAASATNIEDALLYAETLISEDSNRRIILLTDGKQTDGDATSAATQIAEKGVRIDTVLFDSSDDTANEVQINEIELPETASSGDTIDIKVTVQSTAETTGTLTISDGDEVIGNTSVSIAAGVNTYTQRYTITTSGTHLFCAELTLNDDTLSQNNTMYSYIKVAGKANVLVIDGTGSDSDKLVAVIKDTYNVTTVLPSTVPDTLSELYGYDEIILMNVSASDLPTGFDAVLDDYANKLGRGILTTGGTNTYIYGSMSGTAFDNFLPINVETDDTQTVALMILIDDSSSMTGTNLAMAKEGAIKSINSLSDTDYIGVIAFSSSANIISEITPVTNKDSIIDSINELATVRGTYMYEAVCEAYDELKTSDADIKHVIILSDGNPNDSGYDTVIKEMNADGITTSTIALGSGANTTEMQELASIGGGRYYEVSDTSDLPDVMFNETVISKKEYTNTSTFIPTINSYTKVLSGVSSLPELNGYIGTSLKDNATLVLSTGEKDPIYAQWKYGAGQVASFTSDLNGQWSDSFLSSTNGITFIKNMVASVLPSEQASSGLSVDIEDDNMTSNVKVTTTDQTGTQSIEATSVSPSGTKTTTTLSAVSPGVYETTIDTSEEGIYTLTVQQIDSSGNISDYTQLPIASSYSKEYDAFAVSNTDLLSNICSLTGGQIMTTVKELFSVPVNKVEKELNLFTLLVISVLVFFISDIALRKFKLKKLEQWWDRKKRKPK